MQLWYDRVLAFVGESIYQGKIRLFMRFLTFKVMVSYSTCAASHIGMRRSLGVGTMHYLPSFRLATTIPAEHHIVQRSLVCVEGRGRISLSDLTQDIKAYV